MGERCIELSPGDVLLFYTDGLTESFSPDGEMFGEERLAALLCSLASYPPAAMLDALEAALFDFTAQSPLSDDVTLIAVRREE